MTEFHTYDKSPRVGRKKLWTKRLTLPLDEETVRRLDDASRQDSEDRLSIIRMAIDTELRRRERKQKRT